MDVFQHKGQTKLKRKKFAEIILDYQIVIAMLTISTSGSWVRASNDFVEDQLPGYRFQENLKHFRNTVKPNLAYILCKADKSYALKDSIIWSELSLILITPKAVPGVEPLFNLFFHRHPSYTHTLSQYV